MLLPHASLSICESVLVLHTQVCGSYEVERKWWSALGCVCVCVPFDQQRAHDLTDRTATVERDLTLQRARGC